MTYPLAAPSGASAPINVDILDAETGQTRLSRTILAPERGRVARPHCLPGPPGSILVASGTFVEQIDLASLATRQRLSLPGDLIDVIAIPGVPGRLDSVLFTSAGARGFSSPSPSLRALDIANTPLREGCAAIPDGIQCPDLVLLVNAVTPRIAMPGKAFSAMATHGGHLYGLGLDTVTPFVALAPESLARDTRGLAREGSLPALITRVATLATLNGGADSETRKGTPGIYTAAVPGALSLATRALAARLTIIEDDPSPYLARLWSQAAVPAQDIAQALISWRYGADRQGAANFVVALGERVPFSDWSAAMLIRGAAVLERGGRSLEAQGLRAAAGSGTDRGAIPGGFGEDQAQREIAALVARSRAALAQGKVDEAEGALLAIREVQGREGFLPDSSDALLALTTMDAWDDAGMKKQLRDALGLLDRALATTRPAKVDAVPPACLEECAQVARDCSFLFPTAGSCARVPGRCAASCAQGQPTILGEEASWPRSSDAWWHAILGDD